MVSAMFLLRMTAEDQSSNHCMTTLLGPPPGEQHSVAAEHLPQTADQRCCDGRSSPGTRSGGN